MNGSGNTAIAGARTSTLISDDVTNTLARQHKVMQQVVALAYADTVLPGQPGVGDDCRQLVPGGAVRLQLSEEKCDLYMHDLFVLNREHDASDTILKAISAASTAIVGGTLSATNAKIPLLVVAQTFGLVEGINDAAAKSYLFEQVPGLMPTRSSRRGSCIATWSIKTRRRYATKPPPTAPSRIISRCVCRRPSRAIS